MSKKSAVSIKVRNVHKTYCVWRSPTSRLIGSLSKHAARTTRILPSVSEKIMAYRAGLFEEFHALKDISFELNQGDSLGIIGPNGSGKSTLLQIVAGLIMPTRGFVEVTGTMAALLELGSGFNQEFTGRENVFINGSILGIPRSDIEAKFDDIAAFADIGDYIDRPIKYYSTGMVMRLAFSVQVHIEPDVLIVDEALAVGDAAFKAKAISKIEELLNRNTTLLFVGHDLESVRSFCNHAIYIRQGQTIASGDPDEITRRYMYDVQHNRVKKTLGPISTVGADGKACGIKGVSILEARFIPEGRHMSVSYGTTLQMLFRLKLDLPIKHPRMYLDIMDLKGLQISGRMLDIPTDEPGSHITCRVSIDLLLQKGLYRVRVRIAEAPSLYNVVTLQRHDMLLSFEVVDDSRKQFLGLFPIPIAISWHNACTSEEL